MDVVVAAEEEGEEKKALKRERKEEEGLWSRLSFRHRKSHGLPLLPPLSPPPPFPLPLLRSKVSAWKAS